MTESKGRCLVWVDHHEARIIHPLSTTPEFEIVVLENEDGRAHERKHDGGHRHVLSTKFADRVAEAVSQYKDLAVTGPSTARDELMLHLREQHRDVAKRVLAIESLQRATDPQLAAHAREIFDRLDTMRGIHVPQTHD